jgi:hypothetical protein
VFHTGGADQLAEPSLRERARELHLPQPILRDDEAFGHEEVAGILRVDMRHAPLIAHHRHRCVQAGNLQDAAVLRHRCLRQGVERRHGSGGRLGPR